ncbi:MAG: hypothetical protein RJA09_2544 [Pseudomonadota bacterium]
MVAEQLSLEGFDGSEAVAWCHPQANRECVLGGCRVAYVFQRAQRRTIGLTVSGLGLSVRAPRWVALHEVEAYLVSKAPWILDKLRLMAERQTMEPPALVWAEGAEVPYLGRVMVLRLDPSHGFDGVGARLAGADLCLGLPHAAAPDRIRDTAQAWLMREAERVLAQRLDHFAALMGVVYQRLRLSSASTRWGSATAQGVIRLNWRLVHLDMALIDYVVVHELSHLREMNHSPAFWRVVGSVLPDHVERRQALRRVRLPRA